MPPRSYSYSTVNNVSYDDQCSDIDNDSYTKSIYASFPSLTKSVCFSNQVETVLVERIEDYTADEIAAVWYNKNDFEEMKIEIKVTVRFMETGTKLPSDKTSIRGLEHKTRAGAWRKFQNKRIAYCAVLDEQDNQWANNIDDPDAIAQVYAEHSALCHVIAQKNGRKDAIEAQKVYRFSSIHKYLRRRNK